MKHILLGFLLSLFSVCALAQNHQKQEHGERMTFSPEQYKKELECFITKEACLTQAEAQKFFPMLHEMFNKQRELNTQSRQLVMSTDKMTNEKDIEEALTKATNLDIQSKKLTLTYYKKFHTVLSWKKISLVKKAFGKFQMEALKKFQPNRRKPEAGRR